MRTRSAESIGEPVAVHRRHPLEIQRDEAEAAVAYMSQDLFWWWWLVHLWVEATWEVLIGCIMAWTLIHLVGA